MAYVGPFPLRVQQGGTGEITLAANTVLIGENTTDIAVTNVGTNGQLLIAGTANKPAFATLTSTGGTILFTPGINSLNLESSVVGGIQTINGNSGSVTGAAVTLTTGAANDNGTVKFTGAGTTMTMTYEDGTSNLGLGDNALKNATITSSSNIGIGTNVFSDVAFAAANNLGIGISAGVAVTIGANNTFLGNTSGQDITSGSFNIGVGFNTLNNLVTGNRNIIIGESSGNSYTTSEGSNIIIGTQTAGTVGESNTLRIGSATGSGNNQLNRAFISGIDGINIGSVAKVVTMASNQMGTATVTAGAGISVTPGANTITIALSAPVSIANGGTNATSMATSNGTILFDGTRLVTTATGLLGQVLTSNGAGVSPTYQAVSASGAVTSVSAGNNITITGTATAPIVNVSGTTTNTLQIGNGSGSLTSLAAATNGQIPIGSTGAAPVIATITAGSGISVTNGAGSITIASTAGSFTWNEETGTSATMVVNNGYIANNAGLVTFTLPATAALGSVVRVTGKGAGGWRIAQPAGDTIYFGTSTTTTGVTGRLDSTQIRDSIELVCVTANTNWNVLSSIGNISVT